ncbi:uncharacterized protein PHACADRAFT_265594 [Phanerochaete carnosa HHB-10118-sp]|uniref:Uncharacterized protein n=1 Tax=Phanerochaete carnosa (strain HHB-10118-sp) TaxID=650164 RepID=K5UJX5_PHACS|nr:uncharacterized protein PHACADRAFT_265594 [Phanerochaete carnosa HHB-10118-sp]EKM49856.1 hypothetical protein PHACADRAFT_265594 [Phanerochaete carnosa HHB-10118-sp]
MTGVRPSLPSSTLPYTSFYPPSECTNHAIAVTCACAAARCNARTLEELPAAHTPHSKRSREQRTSTCVAHAPALHSQLDHIFPTAKPAPRGLREAPRLYRTSAVVPRFTA